MTKSIVLTAMILALVYSGFSLACRVYNGAQKSAATRLSAIDAAIDGK